MMMKSADVGAIPVVSDRTLMQLVGIVTDRDLAIKVIAEQRDMYKSRVDEVMTTDLYICKPGDDYDDVLKMMSRHQIRRIPVVDDNKRLVGIVSQADVARNAESPKDVGRVVSDISQPESAEAAFHVGKAALWIAGGLGLGAGLFYLLDPDRAQRLAGQLGDAMSSVMDSVQEQMKRDQG
jgi:signal-transduction protein with cAMP-binding, CBS, and nucleotidyltransferase domain